MQIAVLQIAPNIWQGKEIPCAPRQDELGVFFELANIEEKKQLIVKLRNATIPEDDFQNYASCAVIGIADQTSKV